MSKKSKQTGAETGDDVSSLFAKLGSSGATAYQDFSADRLSAAEPAAAAPPPAAPAPAPVLSVVRAAVEPRPAAPSPATPLPVAPAAPAAPLSAAVIGTATGTPLQQLFQRLLEVGREAAVPAPGGPLKRFLNR
ncbi:hypothetical protein NB699_000078 [Xanthomonas sacchari]|uniref:Uncharacterized protein n=1 Tax=Xanthomonas sacchari TaxID=56458 RepID=A0AA46SVX3_9XANT|nr:hypothetical protein [Xanthomonas sacchari]AJC45939.1 hypothetical protein SB85_09335 [Xanthomonas sacchari]MCW0365095.1 hypothetical protein [Xanthomonas sacchari]MCW0439159.1 hypothetical protein [Xanthomonas sacchari]UYK89514.1 hypothetical protein NG824_03440 [Xanthomonas sacchari]